MRLHGPGIVVWLESEVGRGSTFSFSLPLMAEPVEPAAPETERLPAEASPLP